MGDKNDLKTRLARVEELADATKLITDMTTKLAHASTRWEEVCRVYEKAWDEAFAAHVGVLDKISALKKQREQALKNRVTAFFELACIFLPVIGGKVAVRLAPILTARGQLLAGHVQKTLTAEWNRYTADHALVSKAMGMFGEYSVDQAKEFGTAVKNDIIDSLAPKLKQNFEVAPSDANPVDAFINRNKAVSDSMHGWVSKVSDWNVAGGWKRHLVPIAHDMFLAHPWIRKAPPVEDTQALKPQMVKFIEIALWLTWARTLDEAYWKQVDSWYNTEYVSASRNVKVIQVQGRARRWATDALDFASLWTRIRGTFPRNGRFGGMTILDPDSGMILAEGYTVNLYSMIRTAKNKNWSFYLLQDQLRPKTIDSSLTRVLAEMYSNTK